MLEQSSFVLPELNKHQKSIMLGYAEQVLKTQQQMTTKTGKNILHYTLQRKRRHKRLEHYPKGDRIDQQSGAQYFYHCHRENMDNEEHGHFHCFLRYKYIPKHIKPTPLTDWDKNLENPMTHLVAIGMNRYGQPIRLFTVNRWISSEIWYDAKHIAYFLKRYKMTLSDDPYWMLLDQWVEAMLQLFSPQITWILQQRDRSIAHHQQLNPGDNAYENQTLEELSEINIDLSTQVTWLLNAP